MAPFRASRSSRFGRPGAQGDVDIIDGLPVRQWRLQEAVIGSSNGYETTYDAGEGQNGTAATPGGWPELPMPKGSNLYAPWCQQLLRAARAGRTAKRKEPGMDEDNKENDVEDDHAPVEPSKNGFVAQRWAPIPRRLEEPEREYLAKRRKGLPSAHVNGAAGAPVSGPGGEVVTAVGLPVNDEPIRKRVPPPRRKPKKGPGRRRKLTAGPGIIAPTAPGTSFTATAATADVKEGDGAPTLLSQGGEEEAEDDDEEEDEEGDEDDEADDIEEGEIDDDREEGEIKEEVEDTKDQDLDTAKKLPQDEVDVPLDTTNPTELPLGDAESDYEPPEAVIPNIPSNVVSNYETPRLLPGLDLHNQSIESAQSYPAEEHSKG